MSPRDVIALLGIACICQVAASPVRRTLNFNMFVLRPKPDAPDRLMLATDGVPRNGPILEYLVHRVQGILSEKTRKPSQDPIAEDIKSKTVPIGDMSENEIDGVMKNKKPIVVRPSRTKPGTFEVEIDVLMDDEQLNKS